MDLVPYLHAEPKEEGRLPLRVDNTRVGLLVPPEIAVHGIGLVPVADKVRSMSFRFTLVLVTAELRFRTKRVEFEEIVALELKDNPDVLGPDVMETWDIDFDMIAGLRWDTIRRQAVQAVHLPVLIAYGKLDRPTTLLDEELTEPEIVALCWLQSRLQFSDKANVLIASQLGISSDAAGQRVRRLAAAGVIPPPERQGQRKVRP